MSYTKIAKPGAQTYTTLTKPRNGFVIPVGTVTGLIAPPTYASAHTLGNMYINILKPSFPSSAVLIQSQKGYTGSTPITITYPSPVTVGNLLVVCVSSDNGSNLGTYNFTVSDNQNNTWTKVIALEHDFNLNMAIYYAVANGNNTPAVTLNTLDADIGGSIYEYSNLTPVIDNNNSNYSINTVTPTGSALVTTHNSVIIAMAAQEANQGTFSANGGGFTLKQSNGNHIDAVADFENVAAGSYSSIFNFNGSATTWGILQVAFRTVLSGSSNYTKINKPT